MSKKSALSLERIEALEALGVIWHANEEDYQSALGYLKGYNAEHGHCRVHQRFKTEDGCKLGSW